MYRNLAGAVIEHGRIRTTVCRAKEMRRVIEKLIHYAQKQTSGGQAKASAFLFDRSAFTKLWTEFPTRFAGVGAGYTRILRLGCRRGDGAEMCYFGFTDVLPSRKAQELAQKKVRDEAAAARTLG